MRTAMRKLTAVLLIVCVWLGSFGGSLMEPGKAVLDVNDAAARVTAAMAKEVQIPGKMAYKMPKSFSAVETALGNVPGFQYRLNEIPETYQTAAEQLYVFYFENEKHLLYREDGKNTAAVEMAIVKNILPGEKVSGIVAGAGFPTASRRDRKGTAFDYYSSEYTDIHKKTHHVEFVFTKDGDRGLGCLVYVFTDPVHRGEILYLMDNIRFLR